MTKRERTKLTKLIERVRNAKDVKCTEAQRRDVISVLELVLSGRVTAGEALTIVSTVEQVGF